MNIFLKEKSPSQLSEIHGVSDIPIPKLGSKSGDNKNPEDAEGSSVRMPKTMGEVSQLAYNTLPKSWKEQNIVTSVKENVDPTLLEERQQLVKNKTPAELAQIRSLADLPVPSRIKNIFDKKEMEKPEPKKRRR